MTDELGTVEALRRYPVKSMVGEALTAVDVTERGLTGDRRYAVLDRGTGKIASAKTPRLWRKLLSCSASFEQNAARIGWPNGKSSWSTDISIDEALSALLGRDVALIRTPPPKATLDRSRPEEVLRQGLAAEVEADIVEFGSASPAGTFFDFAPIHLVSTSTLARIAELSPRGTIEAERYRPNIVINSAGTGFVENAWLGKELHIGEWLTLRVVARTPRCAVPTLAHGTWSSQDVAALRTLAEHNRVPAMPGRNPEPCAGVYAQVLRPGRIRPGDFVRMWG